MVLDESQSLRPTVPAVIAKAYAPAREEAAFQTGRPLAAFAPVCPWTPVDILNKDWLPAA